MPISMTNLKTLILLLFVTLPLAVAAEDSQQKGLQIAQAAKDYDKGFTDFTADMTMILKNMRALASSRRL